MNLLRRNLIANLGGRGWTALMALVFIPCYIHYLGIEAYGLVGFFATLQAACVLLDLGLSTAVNHGLATLAARDGSGADQRDLVRTMEVLNWAVALLIGVGIVTLAPIIASNWIDARGLGTDTVCQAVRLMGLTIALRWPSTLYIGALTGLQRQLSVNLIGASGATLGNAGVIAILAWVAPSIEAFFVWQLLAAVVQTLIFAWWVHRCLPVGDGQRSRFSKQVLAKHWRFAAGMGGITVLSLLLTQTDKVVLSKLLTLEHFAYYALASTVANALLILVTPLFAAAFPAFSTAIARNDQAGLRSTYHRTCRLAACLILPPAMVVAGFPATLLWAWSGDAVLAAQAGPVLGILVLGSALNGLMNIPYAIQLAHGSTRLFFWCNLVAVMVQVPLVIGGALLFGPVGAALGWPLLNLCYVVLITPLIHRRALPGAQREWLLHDAAIPLLLALAAVACCLTLAPSAPSRLVAGAFIAACTAFTFVITWTGSRRFSGKAERTP
jgi:O-antigen/teichoic acid export membrane protein